MHDAEGVFKSGMHRARVDLIGPGQLANAAEPLICGFLYDLPLPVIEGYESMNRAANFKVVMRVHGAALLNGELAICIYALRSPSKHLCQGLLD